MQKKKMTQRQSKLFFTKNMLLILCGMFFICFPAVAQIDNRSDTNNVTYIHILENDYSESFLDKNFQKLIGNVKLLHETDTLYCDSAYLFQNNNLAEAWGDVLIRQADGTEAIADYVRYTGSNKTVYMRGNVTLTDNNNNDLWSHELHYNLNTKIGRYTKGGTLLSENTLLSSKEGVYNLNTKEARFKKDVIVTDPQYRTQSTDLGYNTETKLVHFFGPSVVSNPESLLQTSGGIYHTSTKTSFFDTRSSIFNDGLYIEGDTLDYDKNTGLAIATGRAIAIDTANKTYFYSGTIVYNELDKTLWAYRQPILKTLNEDNDSFFMRSDTFFSGIVIKDTVIMNAQDSLQQTIEDLLAATDTSILRINEETATDTLNDIDILIDTTITTDDITTHYDSIQHRELLKDKIEQYKNRMDKMVYGQLDTISSLKDTVPKVMNIQASLDSLKIENDSLKDKSFLYERELGIETHPDYKNQDDDSAKRFFIAYHNVLIYSDSLQGKCDSMYYSQADSTIRMYLQPILWPKDNLIKGDRIYIQLADNKIQEIYVPINAILIGRAGPEQSNMFDQIQGNSLRAYIVNNEMDSLVAEPDAQSIYYAKDEDEAYIGVSEASGERIEIIFKEGDISIITYRNNFEQLMTPILEAEPINLRLNRFAWPEELRPKTFFEFIGDDEVKIEPDLWKY